MPLSDETLKEMELRGPAWVQQHELLALIAEVRQSRAQLADVVPVLEFYGDENNYHVILPKPFNELMRAVNKDGGKKARDLLAKLKEGK